MKRPSLFAGLSVLLGCISTGSLPPLDDPGERVVNLALELTADHESDREKAIAIFNYVRDEVQFGFTRRFDGASPNETLAAGRGHCNPQAALFASMLRAVGIDARMHFVTIGSEIIVDLFPDYAAPPRRIAHSYVDVVLDGTSYRVDGYLIDDELLRGAKARLGERVLGYGVHRDACNEWDGRSDCMAQFADRAMQLADHGRFDDPRGFYASEAYTQRLGALGAVLYRRFALGPANDAIAATRAWPE